jgi:hypothetical protein
MNDNASIIKWAVSENGGLLNTDIDEMNMKLNRMPMKPIEYKFSLDAVRKLLS